MRYAVTIVKTIKTEIVVNAESVKAARSQLNDYGLIEAISDYCSNKEEIETKITSVKALEKANEHQSR